MSLRPITGLYSRLFAAFIALLLLNGCSQISPSQAASTVEATAASAQVTALPGPTAQEIGGSNLTPLPVVTALLSPLPTPSATDGVVVGRALKLTGSTAITATQAYLAKVYWNADHTSGVFALDVNVAPTTMTQANGDFIFTGVPEGEYAFAIGNPDRKTSVLSNANGSAQTFKVTAGQVVSLGDVRMDY